MYAPSYEFRNYLFKIVTHTQGVINYSDFPKIHEDTGNPRNQIISLSHLLENAQQADIFGDLYTELADRLYKGWFHIRRENTIKKIISLKTLVLARQKSKSFHIWAVSRPRPRPKELTRSVDYSVKSLPVNSGGFIAFPKESEFKFSSPDAKQTTGYSPKPSIPLLRHSASASQFEKEYRDEKEALHNRLYEDAAIKKALLERSQAQDRNRGMEECTFRPEITDYTQKRPPVFERLNTSDVKEKGEFYKKQKESKELEGCTFHPKTNSAKSLSMDRSFDQLYKDAELQRQKLRNKELLEKDREMVECTFRPTVLNPTAAPSGSVYEKLYNSYQESQKAKRRMELERKTKEDDESKFIPKLLTPKREGDSTPVYARLYAEVEKRREKLKKRNEEKERSNSGSRSRKPEDPPRYEHLYSMHKESQEKKVMLQEKYFKESGAIFKPDTSKSNTPKRSRAHSPKIQYPLPKKPTDMYSEPSIH